MSQHDNLARQSYAAVPVQKPYAVPQPHSKPIHIEEPKKKIGLTRLEKGIITLFSAGLFGLSFMNISAGIEVSALNQAYQDTNREIETSKVMNANLEQQVQELSRYDRIYTIAEQFGLKINEENVRNVSE